jgi:hypothetical protein
MMHKKKASERYSKRKFCFEGNSSSNKRASCMNENDTHTRAKANGVFQDVKINE